MYTVTLEQDYFKAVFEFGTGEEALRFMNIARNHYLPYDDDGEPCEMEITMKIEKCAGSGNSEVAHIKNQENDSTD